MRQWQSRFTCLPVCISLYTAGYLQSVTSSVKGTQMSRIHLYLLWITQSKKSLVILYKYISSMDYVLYFFAKERKNNLFSCTYIPLDIWLNPYWAHCISKKLLSWLHWLECSVVNVVIQIKWECIYLSWNIP